MSASTIETAQQKGAHQVPASSVSASPGPVSPGIASGKRKRVKKRLKKKPKRPPGSGDSQPLTGTSNPAAKSKKKKKKKKKGVESTSKKGAGNDCHALSSPVKKTTTKAGAKDVVAGPPSAKIRSGSSDTGDTATAIIQPTVQDNAQFPVINVGEAKNDQPTSAPESPGRTQQVGFQHKNIVRQEMQPSVFVVATSDGVSRHGPATTLTSENHYCWNNRQARELVLPFGDTLHFQLYVTNNDAERQVGQGSVCTSTLSPRHRDFSSVDADAGASDNDTVVLALRSCVQENTFLGCIKFRVRTACVRLQDREGSELSSGHSAGKCTACTLTVELLAAFCMPEVASLLVASSSPPVALEPHTADAGAARQQNKLAMQGAIGMLAGSVFVGVAMTCAAIPTTTLCHRPLWHNKSVLCQPSGSGNALLNVYWVSSMLSGAGELYGSCKSNNEHHTVTRLALAVVAAVGSALLWLSAALLVRRIYNHCSCAHSTRGSFSVNRPVKIASFPDVTTPESADVPRQAPGTRQQSGRYCPSRAWACPILVLCATVVFLALATTAYLFFYCKDSGDCKTGPMDGVYFAVTMLSTAGTGTVIPTLQSDGGQAMGVLLHLVGAALLALLVHTIARLGLVVHSILLRRNHATELSLGRWGVSGLAGAVTAAPGNPNAPPVGCSGPEFVLHAARSLGLVTEKDIQEYSSLWDKYWLLKKSGRTSQRSTVMYDTSNEGNNSLFERQATNLAFQLQKLTLDSKSSQSRLETVNANPNPPGSGNKVDASKFVSESCDIIEVLKGEDGARLPHRLRVALGSTIRIGRQKQECQLCLLFDHISRLHAKLYFSETDKQLWLEPISSTNPTYCNRVLLPIDQRYRLKDGDVFVIADRAFRVDMRPSADFNANASNSSLHATDSGSLMESGNGSGSSSGSRRATAATGVFLDDARGVVVAETLILSYEDDENDIQNSPPPEYAMKMMTKKADSSLISKLELALMSTDRFKQMHAGKNPMSSDEFREFRLKHLKEIEYTLMALPGDQPQPDKLDFADAVLQNHGRADRRKLGLHQYSQAMISTLHADGKVMSRYILQSNEEVSIGRSPKCGIRINDVCVSRQHCTIRLEPDEAMLTPHSDINTTIVNSEIITENTALYQGDLIEICGCRFRFELSV